MSVFARTILRIATHNPPAPLADWAAAMRREYDELRGGDLGWALGCAGAMAFARLRVERYYWALLVIAPLLLNWAQSTYWFPLMEWFRGDTPSPYLTRRAAYIVMDIHAFSPFIVAALIGFYRPRRAITTMLFGGLVMQHAVHTLWISWQMNRNVLAWWNFSADLYNGPALIGLAASLGIWYAGARTGGWIAGVRDRRFA
jgi:hypothetical protein